MIHMHLIRPIVLCLYLLTFLTSIAHSEESASKTPSESRLALVIGNGSYKVSPLTNPPNDAKAVAKTLRDLGFKVIEREDATFTQMQDALREFGDTLKLSGGVGLFYYAGHGIQYKNSNYLLPVDSDIQREDEVPFVAFDVTRVLQKIESAGSRLNVVILDACRNNPFARSFRSNSGGLAQMDAPTGTIVAFSTAPGSVASDGQGNNGLYTQHLLANITEPNLKIEEVFKKVRVAVKQSSKGQQVPWENTSLEGDFYFNTTGAKIAPPIEVQKIAMAAPSTISDRTIQINPLVVGNKWRYNYTSKSRAKKGQLLFEVVEARDNRIEETLKLRLYNESTYELSRTLLQETTIGGFTSQNGYLYMEFAPYLTNYKDLVSDKNWPKITTSVPTGSYLSSYDWTFNVKTVGKETISTPAGKFETIKIEVSGSRPSGPGHCEYSTGSFKDSVWYAPEIKRYVKRILNTQQCALAGSGVAQDDELYELADYSLN